MNAEVVLGKTRFTVRGADHLHVFGQLVAIQRSLPAGFETIAVAGDDLLVTVEPVECTQVDRHADGAPLSFPPVEQPLD
jgi:hypothetical protein